MEAVIGQVAAQIARYTGPLLIALVSASCGFVIGAVASTVRITP